MGSLAYELMSHFKGLEKAHGKYDLRLSKEVASGEKVLGKPSTVQEQVTLDTWQKHIDGHMGLGIVPIMDDSCCYFGTIDIDEYVEMDYAAIARDIEKLDIPVVPCKTKSGGIHCFCFVSEKVEAALMREKLKLFASILGFGDAEIFPKQVEILAERGDIGQWINMPYFNASRTNRYGFKLDGSPMNPEEFLEAVINKKMSAKAFKAFTLAPIKELDDGPPCLQYLMQNKFQTGSRNDGFFNLCIYLKKANPDDWRLQVDDYNVKYVQPQLSSAETQSIVGSISKRDYLYTCRKPPIKNHCNVSVCRTRKHGIQVPQGLTLTGLTKYDSRPPVWFVDVQDSGRLELTTEDMQSQQRFQRRCMESLNIMPPVVAPPIWRDQITKLLENVNLIEAPAEASPKGMMFEFLERFCTSRVQGRSIDEILLGKPWSDDQYHWFRLSDFYSFLERNRFKEFKINQIASLLKEQGADSRFVKLKNRGVNAWRFPSFSKITEDFDEPTIIDKNIL